MPDAAVFVTTILEAMTQDRTDGQQMHYQPSRDDLIARLLDLFSKL